MQTIISLKKSDRELICFGAYRKHVNTYVLPTGDPLAALVVT